MVTPIDVATSKALAPIALGRSSGGQSRILISPDGKRAYVSTGVGVDTINLNTNTISVPLVTGESAAWAPMALSADGKTLYFATTTRVLAVTVATGHVRASFALPASFNPYTMALTPDGRTLYVSNLQSTQNPGPPAEVLRIDTGTGAVSKPLVINVPLNEGHSAALAVTPDQAPVARVVAHATCARVSFDATGSTVRYGIIVKYAWDFGDGHSAVSATPKTTHSYAHAGPYPVTVTETDSAGTSTQQVFGGQMMTLNGGPSATASITTKTANCAPQTVQPQPSVGAADLTGLPRTGSQTSDELIVGGLLLVGGAGMVTITRKRRG